MKRKGRELIKENSVGSMLFKHLGSEMNHLNTHKVGVSMKFKVQGVKSKIRILYLCSIVTFWDFRKAPPRLKNIPPSSS